MFGTALNLSAPQDLTTLGGVLVIAYLIVGEHAQLVCNLTTALPAAFFTYQLLTGPANVSSYKAALTYWTIQASLLLFDQLFRESSAYFAGKFLILHAVFYHIQRTKLEECESSTFDYNSVHRVAGAHDDTLVSRYIDPFLSTAEESVTAVMRRTNLQGQNAFSKGHLHAKQHNVSPNETRFEKYFPSPTTSDAQTANEIFAGSWYNPPKFSDGLTDQSFVTGNERLSAGHSFVTANASAHDAKLAGTADSANCLLETVPAAKIIFRAPFADFATIAVKNVSANPIMWVLKSNASDRIVATPTYGLLAAKGEVRVKVACREGTIVDIHRHNDQLALDCIPVPTDQCDFDPQTIFQKNSAKQRKRFDIEYIN